MEAVCLSEQSALTYNSTWQRYLQDRHRQCKSWFVSTVTLTLHHIRGRGSSVSTVSDYRLKVQAIDVRSPAEVKGFLLYPLY
jgi:hypothetical protein